MPQAPVRMGGRMRRRHATWLEAIAIAIAPRSPQETRQQASYAESSSIAGPTEAKCPGVHCSWTAGARRVLERRRASRTSGFDTSRAEASAFLGPRALEGQRSTREGSTRGEGSLRSWG